MADITMCANSTCKVRFRCYRYMAPVNEHRQSVAMFGDDSGKQCIEFISIQDRIIRGMDPESVKDDCKKEECEVCSCQN